MYIDPTVSEWIETERHLCMPLFSSNGLGVHHLVRRYSERAGIDLDTVSVSEYTEAIQDWEQRVFRAFDQTEKAEQKKGRGRPAPPKPRHPDRPTPLYLEGYINKFLLNGIVTLDNYHSCLQMPVCTFLAGVRGAVLTRNEVYRRQGDFMAEIANIFSNGKKKFKSSDFYKVSSQTEPQKQTADDLYRAAMAKWGINQDKEER